MELSGNVHGIYERVLCETVNWYIVDSVTVVSYSHTPSTL